MKTSIDGNGSGGNSFGCGSAGDTTGGGKKEKDTKVETAPELELGSTISMDTR